MFIAYQRWLGERVGLEGSVHFMSVPAAVSYDVYSLADTVGVVSGPLGRQTMRLGDWSKFGFQVDVVLKLLNRHRSDLSFIAGSRVLSLPDARISYSAGLDQLYSANLSSITIVGAYDRLISFGAVGGLRFTTRSKNDNGIQVTLLGAWFQDEGFTGTLYTLPGTSLERQARYVQNQSFIGVSVALYKSWGPPKVPMRLRKDREP